jgi:bacterioferritin-associated ferredoxin
MIVCLCHRVSDRDIQRAVTSGARCFEVLQDETRLASSCGCCHDCAREVFDAAVEASAVDCRVHAAQAIATAES